MLQAEWSDERDGTNQVIVPTRVLRPTPAEAAGTGLGCFAAAHALFLVSR